MPQASAFQGQLATQAMLVHEVNDGSEQLADVADFPGEVDASVAYLSIPTRPPAEEWVLPSTEPKLNQAYQLLSERLEQVEYLIGYEGDAFASTGDAREDLLSVTAVHPIRREAVARLLSRGRNDWSTVESLVKEGHLVEARYGGAVFYVRRFS
jgi:wyosine [tRNA(Phe)-imidazoG37] synthetase (radical SAM superfamily)